MLEAAAAVFAERGFYGASVEEIAERAGYTRGAFYSNFADRTSVPSRSVTVVFREASKKSATSSGPPALTEELMTKLRERAAV